MRTAVFPGRWGASGAEGCVLTVLPGSAHGRDAVAAGKICQQAVAGKAMGLPGGRGSPIAQATMILIRLPA